MEFKVGDRVRIRDWNDMAKEFGTSSNGDIPCENGFTKGMRYLCGSVCTIKQIDKGDVLLDEWDKSNEDHSWSFSTDMIVKIYDEINHPEHYTQSKHECIGEMIALFGIDAVIGFCKCNIHKYRYRANQKGGEKDFGKADWYMDKLIELEAMCDER